MSKRFYEGDQGTLVVEHNGKLYPFVVAETKRKGFDSHRERFADDYDMSRYGSMSWDSLTEDGEQYVEVEHDQDQANQA